MKKYRFKNSKFTQSYFDKWSTLSQEFKLKDIPTQKITIVKIEALESFITEGEKLLDVQTQSLRSIDVRTMTLITSIGLILPVTGAICIASQNTSTGLKFTVLLLILFAIVFATVTTALMMCILIVQSDNFKPAGYDPLDLLQDITNGYDIHRIKVEHVKSLSRRIEYNKKLIELNGERFQFASKLWLCTFIFLLIIFQQILS